MSDPLSIAGSVVGLLAFGLQVSKQLHDYYSKYKSLDDDIQHILQKTHRLSTCLQTIRDHVHKRPDKIEEESLRDAVQSAVAHCESSLEDLKAEIQSFDDKLLNNIKGVRASIKSATKRISYPLRQSTLKKLEEDIDFTMSELSVILQIFQQIDTNDTKEDLAKISALLQLVRAGHLQYGTKKWLNAPDATVNYNVATKKRQVGTGSWLVNSKEFKTWLAQPSVLWLQGFAGCGKSVLMSTVIQNTIQHVNEDPTIGVAFFFFTFTDKGKQSASDMLRALLLQLASQLGSENNTLTRFYEAHKDSTPTDDQFLDCFRQLVSEFRKVYVLLDALDESPLENNRSDLLDTLFEMNATEGRDLHFLMTSRPEPDIKQAMGELEATEVVLKNASIDADITLFVSKQLGSNRRLQRWRNHREYIEKVFSEKAQGVFRWAECQLKSLQSCPETEYHLVEQLRSLPRTLDDTYAQMLQRIPPVSREFARRILTVLCCAAEPLTTVQVMECLAIELNHKPHCDPTRRPHNPETLLEICPGLIEIYHEVSSVYRVRIAHFSVEEFLRSTRISEFPEAGFFHVQHFLSHEEMTRLCIALLSSNLSQRSCCVNDVECRIHLASYAEEYWIHHFNHCSSSEQAIHETISFLQLMPEEGVSLEDSHRAPHRATDWQIRIVAGGVALARYKREQGHQKRSIKRKVTSDAMREHRISACERAVAYSRLHTLFSRLPTAWIDRCDPVLLLRLVNFDRHLAPKDDRKGTRETARSVLGYLAERGANNEETKREALDVAVRFSFHDLVPSFLKAKGKCVEIISVSDIDDSMAIEGNRINEVEPAADTYEALHNRPMHGSVLLVQTLLGYHAQRSYQQKVPQETYFRALGVAFSGRDDEVVNYLLNLPSASTIVFHPRRSSGADWMFRMAVRAGYEDFINKYLEAKNWDRDLLEKNFSIAVQNHRPQIARLFLECGAFAAGTEQADFKSKVGQGPKLPDARSWTENEYMLDLLYRYYDRGICPDADGLLLYALHWNRSEEYYLRVASVAILLGSDINWAPKRYGEKYVLMTAYEKGLPSVVQVLLKNGATNITRQDLLREWRAAWTGFRSEAQWLPKSPYHARQSSPTYHELISKLGTSSDLSLGEKEEYWMAYYTSYVIDGQASKRGGKPVYGPITPQVAPGLLAHLISHRPVLKCRHSWDFYARTDIDDLQCILSFMIDHSLGINEICPCEDESCQERLSPLACAVKKGLSAIVELLISHGATIPFGASVHELLREAEANEKPRLKIEGRIPLCA